MTESGAGPDRQREAAPTARSVSVLLVEDNVDAREMLALLLTRRGFRVVTAEDGSSGLERAVTGSFDAAVVDIGLPGVDGYEVARRLRAREREGARENGESMLLVALSGYGQPQDRDRSRAAGFDHHLVKPVQPDRLCALLAAARDG